jgi:putative glutathione S-transferase
LYVAHACPWAHRTLIARALLGLEDAISVSLAHPLMLEHGWVFRTGEAPVPDPIHQADYLWQVYVAANPDFTGRVSVPVLWDRKRKTIVNNESRDILQMFSREMRAVAQREIDLAPPDRREEIERVIDAIYQPINNGVYRAGFAKSQAAHERAVIELFDALDHWEDVLSRQRYTCGNVFTEADICLFTTLFRFDIVYVTHFKCNVRRVVDYPNLWGFVRDIYEMHGVARTCDIARTKQHYFGSHPSVNPTGIIPLGPAIDYDAPHGRDRF